MKEIKAYLHSNRIADVIHALDEARLLAAGTASGMRNINAIVVHSLTKAIDGAEQRYSVELGQAVVDEVRLELVCEDHQVDELVALIERTARTGQALAGWIVVTEVVMMVPIKGLHA